MTGNRQTTGEAWNGIMYYCTEADKYLACAQTQEYWLVSPRLEMRQHVKTGPDPCLLAHSDCRLLTWEDGGMRHASSRLCLPFILEYLWRLRHGAAFHRCVTRAHGLALPGDVFYPFRHILD